MVARLKKQSSPRHDARTHADAKIDKDRVNLDGTTYFDVNCHTNCHNLWSTGEVHANKVLTNELQDRNGGWVYHLT